MVLPAPINMNGIDHRPLVPGMAFMFDTTLATVRLVMSGVFQECPGLKLIVPHTGGFVPFIRGRVGRMIDAWTSPEDWVDLSDSSQVSFDKIYVDILAPICSPLAKSKGSAMSSPGPSR